MKKVSEIIRERLLPLCEKDKFDGGYDCCGCGSYSQIVEDAAAIAEEFE